MTTLRIYAHNILPGMGREAVDMLDQVIFGESPAV
jgi:hypothetical protein